MNNPTQGKIYFPNINSSRFIAALSVIVYHIEKLKNSFQIPNFWEYGFIKLLGGLGVTFFFVLSGFLITYLLLAEKNKYQTISIKDFYVRRILRIWPLYYLIITLGLFILPLFPQLFLNSDISGVSGGLYENFYTKVILYFLMLPNLAMLLFPVITILAQTWSIGVEEQFYLMWPLIIKFTKRHFEILVAIVFLFYLLNNGVQDIFLNQFNKYFHVFDFDTLQRVIYLTKSFFSFMRIGCMAIGGIMVYLLFYKKQNILDILYRKSTQVFVYIGLLLMILGGLSRSHEFYSLFFGVIILNLASNPNRLFSLENPVLSYLGKISYGIYMYHLIAIILALRTIRNFDENVSGLKFNLILYLLSISITIIFATLSYYLFENKFLRLKKLFMKVQSSY